MRVAYSLKGVKRTLKWNRAPKERSELTFSNKELISFTYKKKGERLCTLILGKEGVCLNKSMTKFNYSNELSSIK